MGQSERWMGFGDRGHSFVTGRAVAYGPSRGLPKQAVGTTPLGATALTSAARWAAEHRGTVLGVVALGIGFGLGMAIQRRWGG